MRNRLNSETNGTLYYHFIIVLLNTSLFLAAGPNLIFIMLIDAFNAYCVTALKHDKVWFKTRFDILVHPITVRVLCRCQPLTVLALLYRFLNLKISHVPSIVVSLSTLSQPASMFSLGIVPLCLDLILLPRIVVYHYIFRLAFNRVNVNQHFILFIIIISYLDGKLYKSG